MENASSPLKLIFLTEVMPKKSYCSHFISYIAPLSTHASALQLQEQIVYSSSCEWGSYPSLFRGEPKVLS